MFSVAASIVATCVSSRGQVPQGVRRGPQRCRCHSSPDRAVDLSVVIPARNVEATLPEQLDALLAQEWAARWEIIVVDNESTDRTARIAAEYARQHPRVRVASASGGAGVNYVRACGIAAAHSDNIAFCDGDDIAGPHWVAAVGEALRSHAVVTGPLEVHRLNPEWLARTRGSYPQDRIRTYHGLFDLLAGGNFGIHRSVYEEVGGLREDIFGAVDDLEFALRLHQAGVTIHFAPDAVIHYRYRSEPRVLFRQGRFYGRGKPLISKLTKAAGMRAPSRIAGWKSWLLLVAWLPRLSTRPGRASWCWIAGSRLGQVEGCWVHRTLWL
jgi:glycosyltransferase involved in cell wall biosynthesis